MRVEFYKALWGMEHLPFDEALAMIAEAGYDGIETPHDNLVRLREAGYEGKAISMLFPDTGRGFDAVLSEAMKTKPVSITVHAGKSWWTDLHAAEFFEDVLPAVRDTGLDVNFETHRGRLLYEPQSTHRLLNLFPDLYLCADFSHWTCVSESMLHDQATAVNAAIARTRHLHARVGHEEGPQVPDPRSPRWQGHVDRFLELWDQIREERMRAGAEVLTVDPEFGPPNYLWTDPRDGDAPVADLFEVCRWMKDTLQARWSPG